MTKSKTVLLAAVLLLAAVAAQAGDTPWLDPANCAMCENLVADQDLFQHTTWDTYLLTDGMMQVSTVPAGYEERFQKALDGMAATGKRLQAGEQLHLCGSCQSMGKLLQGGADMNQFRTRAGWVTVVTAKDPKLIAMIRDHAQRNIDEMAKYMKEHPAAAPSD